VDDIDDGAAAEIFRDEGSHSKTFLAYSAVADRRDYRFAPSAGHYLRARAEVAGGDVETVRLDLDGRKYWTVRQDGNGNKHVIGVRGRMGVVDAYNGDRVPVFERYFAGGFSTLRGFAYEGVAPVDPATEDQVGGESLLLGSVEYSLPIMPDDALRLLLFSDFGYVKPDVGDLFSGWDELRLSVGIGMRWQVPMLGPMTIETDLAFPLAKEDGDETQSFHFTIGASRAF